MKLLVNGEERETNAATIADLLTSIHINPRLIVVEYNGEIVQRGHYDQQKLSEGDKLEIVQMMAGG